jgi:hypothetical protein
MLHSHAWKRSSRGAKSRAELLMLGRTFRGLFQR